MGVNQNEVLIKGRQYDSILQNTSALQLRRAKGSDLSNLDLLFLDSSLFWYSLNIQLEMSLKEFDPLAI